MRYYRENRDALWRKANFICGVICAFIGIIVIAVLIVR